MFPSLTIAILLASVTLQSAPMPGEYVGERPEDPENARLWQRYQAGILSAIYEDRDESDPVPEFFVAPAFFDGRNMCGIYQSSSDSDQGYVFHNYITRLAHLDFGGPDERRALPVRLVTADASEAELDRYCPNMPANVREGLLRPASRDTSATQPERFDVDPEAIEWVDGVLSMPISWGLDQALPEWPEGTYQGGSFSFTFRQGDYICREYQLSTPQRREWTPHWLVAQIESFVPTTGTRRALPISIINRDASPADVLETCPGIAETGDFRSLMTPEGWWRPGKHRDSIERVLTPALLDQVQTRMPAAPPISVSYAGPSRISPEGVDRVCGWVPVRMTSDYATQTNLAFVADIDATRVEPSNTDPFPTWDVRVVEISLPDSVEEANEACPHLREEQSGGSRVDIGRHVTMNVEEAIAAHRRGEALCYFWHDDITYQPGEPWPDDVPQYPRNVPGGECRYLSYEDYARFVERATERMRERHERLPME